VNLDAAAAAAAGLGPLPLARARARVGGFHGSHARRAAGPGTEFWQYRELQPGEAVDRVDWRRSGRSDALYVREREREDPVRLWLWVDDSGSMDFASRVPLPSKLDRARLLAAAIGLAAIAAGERVADLARPGTRDLGSLGGPALPDAPLGVGDAVLLVGDFLDGAPTDWVERAAAAGAVGVAVSVADPAELEFPFRGRTHFEPVEAGDAKREFARAEAVRSDYLAAWARHDAALEAVGSIPGWTRLAHRTDGEPAGTLAAAAAWLRG
jgi:uncharacterized protein (DUF58 family)